MLKYNTARKGVVLFIVLATILVVTILAAVILGLVSNQFRLTTHQVSRIKAYYAGKGVMNYALDMLRQGTWSPDASGSGTNRYACHGNCTALGGTPPYTYTIPTDSDIPYNILVTIFPRDAAENALLMGNVTQINIRTEYTYTP
ncbi:MAG: hypothetical protein PHV92_01745 [Candidatus Omnitrophica bacterium]|nr:hypothetical protein [Candidatus Omnitrophota bacterium]MDD5518571.1 hypothetical protein [Candidatus Omnitrophota bacterium]